MTDELGALWTSVLAALGQVLIPDWGRVVTDLLPIVVAGVVAAIAALLARVWFRAWRVDPARQARLRRRAIRTAGRAPSPLTALGRPLLLVPVGAAVAGAGLLERTTYPSGNLGLVVGGLALALLGVGLAVRTSERLGATGDVAVAATGMPAPSGPSVAARLAAGWAAVRRLPRPLHRLPALGLAILGVGLGLVLVPPPPAGESIRPVANLPILLLGLGFGLAVVTRAVRDWERLDRGG